MRALFHVNHLWGLGHFTRIAAIANAAVAAGHEATIIAGNAPVAGRVADGVKLVTLPAIRAADSTYATLTDFHGYPLSEDHWARRAAIIAETLAAARPDVLITETFPFGRRKLSREIEPLIAAARAAGAAVVASIRDVPTPPRDGKRLEACADRLRADYDAVLVHGDVNVFGLADIWPGEIPVPARLTGYVADASPPAASRSGVIVSAGSGGDGAPLLTAAFEAWRRGLVLPEERWTFVTGPTAPGDLHETLSAAAPRNLGAEIVHSLSDLPARIAASKLSISRGGYNTVAETVASGTPAVIVPFAPEREPEQRVRAERFAEAGLIVHLPERKLTPEALAAAATTALQRGPVASPALNLDGAAHSVRLLAEIVAGR